VHGRRANSLLGPAGLQHGVLTTTMVPGERGDVFDNFGDDHHDDKIHDAWSDGGSTGPMGEIQGVEALKMLQYPRWQDWINQWFAGLWTRSEALATGSSLK